MDNSLQNLNTSQSLKEWALKIKECRSSGLTVRQWCRNEGIRTQRFYYWQKKLFMLLSPQQHTEFAELPSSSHIQEPSTGTNAFAKISVGSLSVELYANAAQGQIAALLSALKQC